MDNQIVFIKDKSANGTWVNNIKLIKGQLKRLNSGDQISLSYPTSSPHAFAVYFYIYLILDLLLRLIRLILKHILLIYHLNMLLVKN